MYFTEIIVLPTILFSPKIKVATHKTVICLTVTVHFLKFRSSLTFFVYRIAGVRRCSYFADLGACGHIFNRFALWVQPYFGVHILQEEYLPITHSWFAAELSVWQDGGCKQRTQTEWSNSNNLIKNTLFTPGLVICSRDLYWQWTN